MSEPTNGSPAPVWRVQNLEKRVGDLESHNLAVVVNRLENVEAELKELKGGVSSLNRVMWTIAVALIAAALTLATSIATGTIG